MLNSIIKYVLVPEEEIKSIVSRLAKEINHDYADKNLVIVCVLKGSVMFTTDLAKELDVVCEMEFLRASSYGNGTESSGRIVDNPFEGLVIIRIDRQFEISHHILNLSPFKEGIT